jgi:phosphatidylethanolamine-binding protein (PEBP) family uncharacterized protein
VIAAGSTGTSSVHGRFPASTTPDRATLLVTTPARHSDGTIDPKYTCHGANVSPPLKWHGPPEILAGTKEFLVIVRTISNGHLATSWAVAGIGPHVRELQEGTLPPGAVVGRNSFGQQGYSVCPPVPTRSALISMGVYALNHPIALKTGFDVESLKPALESSETHWGSSIMFHNELNVH